MTIENYDTREDDTEELKAPEPITTMPRIMEEPRRQEMAWVDAEPEAFREVLAIRSQNRKALLSWIGSNMNDGTDYGTIKQKKSLWKPGAEKIVGMLGLQVRWPDLESELERMRNGADVIWISCELLSHGQVQAQGAGSRRLRDDSGDGNKAIKMAKKSAMIDAVLNIAGLSEIFTQDIEDNEARDTVTLSEEEIDYLFSVAKELFSDKAKSVLDSLARRRFHLDDWHQIPAWRLADAERSLRDKAEAEA